MTAPTTGDGPSNTVPASVGSRELILGRVRAATTAFDPAPVERTYRGAGDGPALSTDALVDQFIDRLVDYKAEVKQCDEGGVTGAVTGFLTADGASSVVAPPGLPDGWIDESAGPAVRTDDPPLSVTELDQTSAVVTSCAVAVAETGTIVLDGGPGQGRRALTLLPDLHIVVVGTDQLVHRVPDAVGRLEPQRPQTWISGPSATSDIELNRVEGVHGPRRLRVVVVRR